MLESAKIVYVSRKKRYWNIRIFAGVDPRGFQKSGGPEFPRSPRPRRPWGPRCYGGTLFWGSRAKLRRITITSRFFQWIELGARQGRRIKGFEGARAPSNMELHPLTAKSTPSKWKEKLMEHRFKRISNKVIVVLTFILRLYLCKTAVIYYSVLKWTFTSGKTPSRVSTILHPWRGKEVVI